MPTSKEAIARTYDLTPDEIDTIQALALRPICEHCAKPLPPDSEEARICSFECTFCVSCVENVVKNVCPNCGGGFEKRPIRPARKWKCNNYLGAHPASKEHTHRVVDGELHAKFSEVLGKTAPKDR